MMLIESLSAHPCFTTLDHESCRVLDRRCIWLKVAAGAWVIGRRANDRNVYFVMAGRIRPVLHGERRDLIGSDTEAGSFYGELSALEGAACSHSVFAVDDSTVAAMPSMVFVEMVFTHRPLGEAVVAKLVERNRMMTRRVAEAAHISGSRLPYVGPLRSRPPYGRFHVGGDVRHTGGKHRRAR
jgi:CRP/FNR family transcriptional regulator, cyclic AMP receptor protein